MVYLDYNATTPLCDAAREAMLPYLNRLFGNPSSIHAAGREARAAIDDARDNIAALLHAKPGEIIFTGGATESCNLGVLGLARSGSSRGGHIISNKAEHHAVLNAVEHLEDHEGFEVTWLNVSKSGMVDLDQLADSIRPDTKLVSIMTAKNETGVVQPMHEISLICRERGVLLHSDIVQAFGKLDIDVSLVDAGSFAAHKFYGPKGTGFLFVRSGLPIQPLMFGGIRKSARAPGQKMSPVSREWLRLPNGCCATPMQKGSDRRNCVMISGHASQSSSQTRNKMAIQFIGLPTRLTQVLSGLIRKRCSWRWIWKAFARRAGRLAWLAR